MRPQVVNTYVFSNVWHKASSINLLCCDMDKIQSEGNDYVFCILLPSTRKTYELHREKKGGTSNKSREIKGYGYVHKEFIGRIL